MEAYVPPKRRWTSVELHTVLLITRTVGVTSSFRSKTAYVVHEIDKSEKLLSCVITSGKRSWWVRRCCTSLNLWNTGSVLKLCPLTPLQEQHMFSYYLRDPPPSTRNHWAHWCEQSGLPKAITSCANRDCTLCLPWRRSQIATYRPVATNTATTAKRSNSERFKPMTYTQKFHCKQKYDYLRSPPLKWPWMLSCEKEPLATITIWNHYTSCKRYAITKIHHRLILTFLSLYFGFKLIPLSLYRSQFSISESLRE
jgi:hypothetical protein